MEEALAAGEYDVIVDSVGGESLSAALRAIAPGGICLSCGNSANAVTTFDARELYRTKVNARLQTVWTGRLLLADCRPLLTRLVELVREGRLRTPIDAELPWTSVADAADRLVQMKVDGKIVLEVA